MKRFFILLLLLPSLVFAGGFKVFRFVDGDTIDIFYYGKKERIRLLCVDTPESVQATKKIYYRNLLGKNNI